MTALLEHLRLSLRLHLRNRMALLYGYLFPLIFLAAFWVLYRHEKVPLARHMGELLTVAVLGGACFGLPTTLVSERERGVWRRYRLTPVPVWVVVTSTVLARYAIVVSAGLLQLAVALGLGMPLPAHPFDLWVAFTFVSFAFIGLGLVIATLADTVPAVQALGQCIFLPMLIIGGVAVSLASLPPWAQHVSAFFPGRYAVEALQGAVTGPGLSGMRFSLLALALTGAAGCFAGGKLFRWDAQQRFATLPGKHWLLPALGAWVAVGALAEWRGRIAIPVDRELVSATPVAPVPVAVPRPTNQDPPKIAGTPPTMVPPAEPRAPWMRITTKDTDGLDFNLPSDYGVVAPFAAPDEEPDDFIRGQLDTLQSRLASWPPVAKGNDLESVRNLLFVVAVPDTIQMPVERFLPVVVLQYLTDTYPKERLVKILTYLALHPEEGVVLTDVSDLGIEGTAGDPSVVRERAYYYALKFIVRLTGRKTE